MKTVEKLVLRSIEKAIEKIYGQHPEVHIELQKTKKEYEGNYTLVVFPLLKISKKTPSDTATEIGMYLLENEGNVFSLFNVIGGFLNLTLDPEVWIDQLRYIHDTDKFGFKSITSESPLVMIEFSSPNTNKPLHLGHVRNNLLGNSISSIMEANGNRVIRTNIVNDRGIHICKSMLAWKKYGNGETPESSGKKGDHLVGDYYVSFDKHYKEEISRMMEKGMTKEEAEENSQLMKEAREMLVKWENNDPEIRELWKMMNNWVYSGFDETYKKLGIWFDKIYYESNTYLEGKKEILEGLRKGLFYKKEDGSVWADLTDEGLDHKLLLRGDGTSVYMTQDIGTASIRFEDYPIDKMIYVVGNEQNYHFQVLSILLDMLDLSWGRGLIHFSYGMVELPDGKMKSREGTVVDADDLMEEMIESAKDLCGSKKELSEEEVEEISEKVGLGALKYFILKVDAKKNMVFDPSKSIEFSGNTGPFIQYTYTRIQSILRKVGKKVRITGKKIGDKEISITQILSEFPNVIEQAGKEYNPSIIANYLYELAKEYNQFYHDYSILGEDDINKKNIRITLSECTGKIIKTGMNLLGIEVPEKM